MRLHVIFERKNCLQPTGPQLCMQSCAPAVSVALLQTLYCGIYGGFISWYYHITPKIPPQWTFSTRFYRILPNVFQVPFGGLSVVRPGTVTVLIPPKVEFCVYLLRQKFHLFHLGYHEMHIEIHRSRPSKSSLQCTVITAVTVLKLRSTSPPTVHNQLVNDKLR